MGLSYLLDTNNMIYNIVFVSGNISAAWLCVLPKVQKTSNTKLLPPTFSTFLPQNTRSNTIYAHTDHALILADFRCSFGWIWNNTIKENDVNFFREKREATKYVYEYSQLLLYYITTTSYFRFMVQLLFILSYTWLYLPHNNNTFIQYIHCGDVVDRKCLKRNNVAFSIKLTFVQFSYHDLQNVEINYWCIILSTFYVSI